MADRIIIRGSKSKYVSRFGYEDRFRDAGSDPLTQAGQNAVPEKDSSADEYRQKSITMPLDENVWGNDRALLDKLDREVIADRRLFVRVRYVQGLTCDTVYEDIGKEPVRLSRPLEFMAVDLSVAGIGIICEHEIETGMILGIRMPLDGIPYDIKCKVIYCIPLDGKYRAGLKIAGKDKPFIKHLKIFVARTTLTKEYTPESNRNSIRSKF
jgi:hypothetical protein